MDALAWSHVCVGCVVVVFSVRREQQPRRRVSVQMCAPRCAVDVAVGFAAAVVLVLRWLTLAIGTRVSRLQLSLGATPLRWKHCQQNGQGHRCATLVRDVAVHVVFRCCGGGVLTVCWRCFGACVQGTSVPATGAGRTVQLGRIAKLACQKRRCVRR